MTPVTDHPLRYAMANELHARPFPTVSAPGGAVYLALKPAQDAAGRDRAADFAHLIALLDRFGAQHPQPGATHYSGQIGRHQLKWESHTEFVTFTIFGESLSERPFDASMYGMFPEDWLASAPGTRVTSALIRIEEDASDSTIADRIDQWFVPESIAVSRVLEDDLVVAGDFRIDPSGHLRFALFARPGTGDRRIGRVVQRLCEIETYKSMAMLGLARARELQSSMARIDARLSELLHDMVGPDGDAEETLRSLLSISSELENIVAQSNFRFAASGAYETIVNQRIEVLREARFSGRQSFAEFMMRRFDPAMRTVKSTEARLQLMSARAVRAAELLRTRVDVGRSAENQKILASLDRRADLQLRLQRTVEGLSVVAISYYAVSLALYVLGPAAVGYGWSKVTMAAVTTPLVVGVVYLMVRRLRRHIE